MSEFRFSVLFRHFSNKFLSRSHCSFFHSLPIRSFSWSFCLFSLSRWNSCVVHLTKKKIKRKKLNKKFLFLDLLWAVDPQIYRLNIITRLKMMEKRRSREMGNALINIRRECSIWLYQFQFEKEKMKMCSINFEMDCNLPFALYAV